MASEANKNLATRVLTAFVAGPAILGLLFFAPPIAFYGLVLVATFVGATELFRMSHPEDGVARGIGTAICLAVSLALWFGGAQPLVLVGIVVGVPMLAMIVTLARLGAIETAALRIGMTGFAPIYLGSLTLLALLRRDHGDQGGGWVLLGLMLAWLGDTGGYFAGRFLGKHKLYPAVSPKKTVEGAIGGLLGSMSGVVFAHFGFLKSFPLVEGLGLAVVAGSLGIIGDLGESLLKRSTGVKDSGGIVPGHGGILDRIDALLFCSTALYLFDKLYVSRS